MATEFAFARLRPGKFRAIGTIDAQNPLLAGEGVIIPFTTSALGFQTLWPSFAQGVAGANTVTKYISVKATQDVAFAIGPLGLAAADNNDALLQPSDSWQDYMIQPGDLGVRLKGITQSGNFYLLMATP